MIVENLQNQNLELKRQKEICQEENRLLEKANRQKVLEVESLFQTIRELEESILAGGAVANAVRDYQRQVAELNEEKKTLERELARTKVSANRVAAAVANEWKDEGEKLMPVKQWIEERRFLQGEIQRLRDKLTISERTAKAETQLRDKFKLRLKILEEGLKGASNSEPVNGSKFCNGSINKRSSSQTRAFVASISSSVLQQPDPVSVVESTGKIVRTNSLNKKFSAREILAKKNLWAPRSKFFDGRGKENSEEKVNSNGHVHVISPEKEEVSKEVKTSGYDDIAPQTNGNLEDKSKDLVSGFLYDRLQKELIDLRKLLEQKDGALSVKDDEIKLLRRKIDALSKALEVESKKMRREAAIREKEIMINFDDNKQKLKATSNYKRSVKSLSAST